MATPPHSPPTTPPVRPPPSQESRVVPIPPPAGTPAPPSPVDNEPDIPARDDDTELRQQVTAVQARFAGLFRKFTRWPGPAPRLLTEEDRFEDEGDLDWENRCIERTDERMARIAAQDAWVQENPRFLDLVAELAKGNAAKGKERPKPTQASRPTPRSVSEELPDSAMGPPTTPSTMSKRMRSPSVEIMPPPKKNRRSESSTKNVSAAKSKSKEDRAKKTALEKMRRTRERKEEAARRRAEIEELAREGEEQDEPCERCSLKDLECYRKGNLKCSRCRVDRRGCSFRPNPSAGPKISEEVELDSLVQCANDIRDAARVATYMIGVFTRAYPDDTFYRDWIQDFRQLFVTWSPRQDRRWQQYNDLNVPGPSGTSRRNTRNDEMEVDGGDGSESDEEEDEEEEEEEEDRGRRRRKN
ncbi:hypothetical protein CYLTODRAFT_427028 [Cylindrobasidium torrendii FP15055 ss-10]|uniref:Zn(2)-C6 fungal-type domain-containing protein n=1 Tax=Cylindrobasidium torrendii FP15055 ss-10 TaxID=1314674 RepID=A0A0D7AV91_9AGAR|nr:hypothetical protein CYLTODRAFT_427028 [Cylindrobasidium torrendii FP15055 ss-10]